MVKTEQANGEEGGPQFPELEGERQWVLLLLVTISAGFPMGMAAPL